MFFAFAWKNKYFEYPYLWETGEWWCCPYWALWKERGCCCSLSVPCIYVITVVVTKPLLQLPLYHKDPPPPQCTQKLFLVSVPLESSEPMSDSCHIWLSVCNDPGHHLKGLLMLVQNNITLIVWDAFQAMNCVIRRSKWTVWGLEEADGFVGVPCLFSSEGQAVGLGVPLTACELLWACVVFCLYCFGMSECDEERQKLWDLVNGCMMPHPCHHWHWEASVCDSAWALLKHFLRPCPQNDMTCPTQWLHCHLIQVYLVTVNSSEITSQESRWTTQTQTSQWVETLFMPGLQQFEFLGVICQVWSFLSSQARTLHSFKFFKYRDIFLNILQGVESYMHCVWPFWLKPFGVWFNLWMIVFWQFFFGTVQQPHRCSLSLNCWTRSVQRRWQTRSILPSEFCVSCNKLKRSSVFLVVTKIFVFQKLSLVLLCFTHCITTHPGS